MISANYFEDNEDLRLQFEQLIDWKEVVEQIEPDFQDAKKYKETGDERLAFAPASVDDAVEYYRSVFDSLGDIMGKTVSQKSAEMDRIGLKYDSGKVKFPEAQEECYRLLRESGLQPVALSRRYGGLNLPFIAQAITVEIAARADAAFALAFGSVNIAEILERYGSEELCEEWMPRLASGELSCAMALTEPNYGSDLPGVQTKARQDKDGTWRITGAKRFITHACGYVDAPSVILTLARHGEPASGARGLSFFLVKGEDVEIAGIETKMGIHCSPTCEVVYDNAPGVLIGQTGYGLVKYSMGMMNSARLVVAGQALGIASAAAAEAKKYASEREQFGRLIQDIPAVRRMLDKMERETAATRALVMEAGRTVDMYVWRNEHLLAEGMSEREAARDARIMRWKKLADFFTPLSKYYASEMSVRVAYDAVQIHGGAGYTEEYDVARIYRDARITSIYEGTTQLQIVAAIGGVVAGMSQTGPLRAYLDEEMAAFTPSPELQSQRELFEKTVEAYRALEGSDTKAAHADEAVANAARFVIGMLMERSAARLQGDARDARLRLCAAFNLDSLAIMEGNLVRLASAARVAAAV